MTITKYWDPKYHFSTRQAKRIVRFSTIRSKVSTKHKVEKYEINVSVGVNQSKYDL